MVDPYYEGCGVTLYLGDCLVVTEWLGADVLVTDPPYGIDHRPRGFYNPRSGVTHRPSVAERVVGDQSTDLRDEMLRRWGAARPAAVFGSWRQRRPDGVAHRLVWWKRGAPPGPACSAFHSQDEEIYIIGSGWVATSPPLRTVLATDEMRSGASGAVHVLEHPTPKPVVLMETLLRRCPADWVVADPFAGVGSTLVAARNLGRKAVGVEINERYCEIAARRLDQMVLDFGG